MNFIDTHCHIYYDKYNKDIDSVINRAMDNNVKKIICVGVDIESSIKSIQIAEKYDIVYATAGYHPHESKYFNNNYMKELEKLLLHKKVVALGEIGLDYYYNNSNPDVQKNVFNDQLDLAKSLNIPVVIHNRMADNDIYESLKKKKIQKAVIHCFASNLKFAKKVILLNVLLSFTGLITFAKDLENIIENIPIEKIMLETDSPYLTPNPHRGKRNEPYMVKFIADKISNLKNIPIEDVARITTKTASNFFGI